MRRRHLSTEAQGPRCLHTVLIIVSVLVGCGIKHSTQPLKMIVMDPLAKKFACECTTPSSLHDYEALRKFLEKRLQRLVDVTYAEDLSGALKRAGGNADLIIGKRSVILHQASASTFPVKPIAMLTDTVGSCQIRGLFVVRQADPARNLSDLQGHRILLGPIAAAEKHSAAIAKLKERGITIPDPIRTSPRCTGAVISLYGKDADVTVISGYAKACLETGKFIPEGSLRVIGETDPIPFVAVFAGPGLSKDENAAVMAALMAVRTQPDLLSDLASKDGFVSVASQSD